MDKAFYELITESEYENVLQYFPKLFKKLSSYVLYVDAHNCKNYQDLMYLYFSKHIIAYLGSTLSKKTNLTFAIKHFSECIKPKDIGYAGNYLEFKNGNIYDVDGILDQDFFVTSLMDAARDLNMILFEMSNKHALEYQIFRKLLMKFSKEITTSLDPNSNELSSFDYAELAYLNILYEELENFDLEEIVNKV